MKLQINKKVNDVKSAIFAVTDSLNFYIQPDSLKDLNIPKIADSIVKETRDQYGEGFTKANLEHILNKTVTNMSTSTKKAHAVKSMAPKKEALELTAEEYEIVHGEGEDGKKRSFNQIVKELPRWWDYPSALGKLLGKSRQRVINARDSAKKQLVKK